MDLGRCRVLHPGAERAVRMGRKQETTIAESWSIKVDRLISCLFHPQEYMSLTERLSNLRKRRSGLGPVVGIAIELILFATIGFVGLQLLATAGTTSFQPTVVLIAIVVVSIMAALAVAVSFIKKAGVSI